MHLVRTMLEIKEQLLEIITNDGALEIAQNGYVIVAGISVEELRKTAKFLKVVQPDPHQRFQPEICRVTAVLDGLTR